MTKDWLRSTFWAVITLNEPGSKYQRPKRRNVVTTGIAESSGGSSLGVQLRRIRQEDHQFKVCMSYRVSSTSASVIQQNPVSKWKTTERAADATRCLEHLPGICEATKKRNHTQGNFQKEDNPSKPERGCAEWCPLCWHKMAKGQPGKTSTYCLVVGSVCAECWAPGSTCASRETKAHLH